MARGSWLPTAQERERVMINTYSCAWCGDTSNQVLKVINEQNTCELCLDLAREGESNERAI